MNHISGYSFEDSDEKPGMGFIYEGMGSAKEKIKSNFNGVKKCYETIRKIIDDRWDNQLHRPLHLVAYYLNPALHYEPKFDHEDAEVKVGLYTCIGRLVKDDAERLKVQSQLAEYCYARGLFGMEAAKTSRKTMPPAEWWDFYGDGAIE